MTTSFDPEERPYENIVGKGENAGDQHFLLCPECFLCYARHIRYFEKHFIVVCKCLDKARILSSGTGLNTARFLYCISYGSHV